jgi:(p)ppGpp synthase/HD superfamily hydrolase
MKEANRLEFLVIENRYDFPGLDKTPFGIARHVKTTEMWERYSRAMDFAKKKHEGQVRKFYGEPYVAHCYRVCHHLMEAASECDRDVPEDSIIAALLHDTLEDTDCTKEEIEKEFGIGVADLVVALTNDAEEIKRVGKTEHLVDKVNELTSEQLLIKLADRFDNVRDIKDDDDPWSLQYARQTKTVFFERFKNEDILGPVHVCLLAKIVHWISRVDQRR